jgi:hypothetical protein
MVLNQRSVLADQLAEYLARHATNNKRRKASELRMDSGEAGSLSPRSRNAALIKMRLYDRGRRFFLLVRQGRARLRAAGGRIQPKRLEGRLAGGSAGRRGLRGRGGRRRACRTCPSVRAAPGSGPGGSGAVAAMLIEEGTVASGAAAGAGAGACA